MVLHNWDVAIKFVDVILRVHKARITARSVSDSKTRTRVVQGGVLGLSLFRGPGCCVIRKTWMRLCPWILSYLPPTPPFFHPLAAWFVRSCWRSVVFAERIRDGRFYSHAEVWARLLMHNRVLCKLSCLLAVEMTGTFWIQMKSLS